MTLKSSTITRAKAVTKLSPIHPGEVLVEEFLRPLGLSGPDLAKGIRVPTRRVAEIRSGRRGITPDVALRLGRYFRVSAEFWMNLQQRYDLECLRDRLDAELKAGIRPLRRRAA